MLEKPEVVHLNDLYYTIQGEGSNAGRRALFVRMPFCNLACAWCDTSFNKFDEWEIEKFRAFASKDDTDFAVITGGEPTMHKHTPRVARELKKLGYSMIACETNGMFPIPYGINFACVSPKRDSAKGNRWINKPYWIHPEAFERASEFKYVIDEGFDWTALDKHNDAYFEKDDRRPLFLSPEFSRLTKSVEEIQLYIAEHPWWRLSLQTHKFLNIP